MSAPSRDAGAGLSAELEAKLLARLAAEWEAINYTFFRGALRRPVFRLSDTRERLGQWNGELRSLEVSRALVLERAWVEVLEVLKHEVAHQFVDECLAVDETAHGPTFRRVCERLGIDARASGSTDAPLAADDPASRTVDRIRKLLALAQSPNQHEAEAAATAARRLMLKLNYYMEHMEVEAAHAVGPAAADHRRYGFRHLGAPSGRILEHDRRLASILTQYFFVQCLWIPVYRPREGKRGTVLEICGLEVNLVMAEHVLSHSQFRLPGGIECAKDSRPGQFSLPWECPERFPSCDVAVGRVDACWPRFVEDPCGEQPETRAACEGLDDCLPGFRWRKPAPAGKGAR